jgi:phospholipase/lecithinase/hemolysin
LTVAPDAREPVKRVLYHNEEKTMNANSKVVRRAIGTFALLATLGVILNGTALAERAPYARIVVFGDSLEDPGNAFALTGQIATPPFEPIPGAAYAIGGHHFSNGATWVEELGRIAGLQHSTDPAYRNPDVASNYAVGGSRARSVGTSFTAGQQVATYLGYTGGVAPSDALYVFGFGGNDVRDALQDPANALSIIGEAAAAIADNLRALCEAGAEDVLVANVPNLGVTPAIQSIGEPAVGFAAFLSWTLNGLVQSNISGYVQPSCANVRFRTLDLFTLSSAIAAYPGGFGFDSILPCLHFSTTQNAICSNPNRQFFWDAIHPTEAGHAVLAQEALRLIDTF